MVYDQSLLQLVITQFPSGVKRGVVFYVDGYIRGYDGSRFYWVMNPPVEVYLVKDGVQTYIGGGGGNPDGTFHTGCQVPSNYDEGVIVTLLVKLPAGTYWIDSDVKDSEFPLQDYVYEKSDSKGITIKYDTSMATPTVTEVGRYPNGIGVRVSSRLTYTTTGNGIPNQTIKFYYKPSGGTYTQLGNPKTTDGNGYVTSDEVVLSVGEYMFKASFEGTLVLGDSESETTYVITKKSTGVSLEVLRP